MKFLDGFIELILPLALIVGGFFVGVIFERIVLAKLKKFAQKTKWEGDDVVVDAIKGFIVLGFSLLGIFLGILNIPMPAEVLCFLKKAILVAFIFSVTLILSNIVCGLMILYIKKSGKSLPVSIFKILIRIAVFGLGVLVTLETLGISIAPILTAMGVGGLAVALGLKETLSNLFSGFQIILSGTLKIGDYIKLDSGDEGYVEDITLKNITVKSLSNNLVIIPNAKISSAVITNFHQPDKEVGVSVNVWVGYNNDVEKVEKISLNTAKEILKDVKGCVINFEPGFRFIAFEDGGVSFSVSFKVLEFTDQFLIKHEFIKRLHKNFKEQGIEIPCKKYIS